MGEILWHRKINRITKLNDRLYNTQSLYKICMSKEGNLTSENNMASVITSDYHINIEHLLYDTLLSFPLKSIMKAKTVGVEVAREAPSMAPTNNQLVH